MKKQSYNQEKTLKVRESTALFQTEDTLFIMRAPEEQRKVKDYD